MKHVITLALVIALTGCDQATDSDAPDQDTATASANIADEALPQSDSRNEGIKAQVFQFGIYKAVKKGEITDSARTNTGKVVRKPVLEHVSMTDRIPLVRDTYFGFQYRLWNLPPEAMIKPVMPLRKVLIHPEMTLPDGSKSTGWDRSFKGRVETRQVTGFDGYAFNEDYELVEGDWIFQIWYGDKKLIERKFVTVQSDNSETAEANVKE